MDLSFSMSLDPDIDFCVWVLEVDGLHVPPFDHHADGNGLLRAEGLDSEIWRAWLQAILAAEQRARQALSDVSPEEIMQAAQRRGRSKTQTRPSADTLTKAAPLAVVEWPGSAQARARLRSLRQEYDLGWEERHKAVFDADDARFKSLWKEFSSADNVEEHVGPTGWEQRVVIGDTKRYILDPLEQFRALVDEVRKHVDAHGGKPSTINIYWAQYPKVVTYPVAPSAVILAVPPSSPQDAALYQGDILRALDELSHADV